MRLAALMISIAGILGIAAFFSPVNGELSMFDIVRAVHAGAQPLKALDNTLLDVILRGFQIALCFFGLPSVLLAIVGMRGLRKGLNSSERGMVSVAAYVQLAIALYAFKKGWPAAPTSGQIVFFTAGVLALGGVFMASKHSA